MQIFDTQYKSEKGTSSNNFLKVPFVRNERLLPVNDYTATVDEVEVYQAERKNCDKYRLIVTINPLCSNVLFNRMTEVVKNEGSKACVCLNFSSPNDDMLSKLLDGKTLYGGKTTSHFARNTLNYGGVKFTRDTQLTAPEFGFDYKCGLDIFNNHLLRTDSFKTVSCRTTSSTDSSEFFNTIFDYMREYDGTQVYGYTTDDKRQDPLHLYLAEDISSFEDTVDAKLGEERGWLGFTNTSKILTYDSNNNPMEINRVINNRPSCAFIDMCPERDLWYFTPKYNPHRNRYEKNWNYCLTYPSSSTTEGITFIRQSSNSLKIYYFDDSVRIGGVTMCKIVSLSKHGLGVDDVINLYVNGIESTEKDLIIRNLKVRKVDDEYTFYVEYSQQNWIPTAEFISWTTRRGFESQAPADLVWSDKDRRVVYDKKNDAIDFVAFTDNNAYRCNIDRYSNDVSFKQVINNAEVEYYVRIFSRLPNWKFSKTKGDSKGAVYEFTNSISRLAFAKNAYGDDVSQIVFTDDISINGLTDNLGRPLTDIYLTIVKNNAGYREWYGKKGKNIDTISKTVEYSHVFGKNSCAFELVHESVNNTDHQNIIQNTNTNNSFFNRGLSIGAINGSREGIDDDEIEFNKYGKYDGDMNFYGDLCLYSPSSLAEITIDDIWYRFNTAQRELNNQDEAFKNLNYLTYDEIARDDYDAKGFGQALYDNPNANIGREGYRYKPHYRISLRSFGQELQIASPHIVNAKSITVNNGVYEFVSDHESYIEPNSEFIIHNVGRNIYYKCQSKTEESYSPLRVKFDCLDSNTPYFFDTNGEYRIIKRQEVIPETATFLTNGSYQYIWREIYQNGLDNYSPTEEYPFANGALYVEKSIRFFCGRQDPDKLVNSMSVSTNMVIEDMEPNKPKATMTDNYYTEDEISCV